jgi:RND family efflux transporter MFP subunit
MVRRALGLAVCLCGTLAAGCAPTAPPLPPPRPPDVVVRPAVEQEVTDAEEFYGKTQAEKEVLVRARVTGYLDKLNFTDGAEVHEGDVLFEIDPRPLRAEFERAEANVAQAESHLQRLEYDYRRAQTLAVGKSMSREEYDKTSGDLAEGRSALKAAQAARATAKLNLDFCHVTAPISGRISRRYVDPGNMVKADDTALTMIVSVDPVYAYFDVDERTFLRIQDYLDQEDYSPGQRKAVPVSLGLSDREDFPFEGTVDFVDNRVDPDSGSLWLRGTFPNKNRRLTPGLFARVRLPIGGPHKAVLIPEQALATDQGQKYVWVVDKEDHARYRPLHHLGAQHGQLREVKKDPAPGVAHLIAQAAGAPGVASPGIPLGPLTQPLVAAGLGQSDAFGLEIAPGDRVIVSGLQRVRNDPPDPKKPKEPPPDYATVHVLTETGPGGDKAAGH